MQRQEWVERRIGGLETTDTIRLESVRVERRIGGLESNNQSDLINRKVERRIGGLETLLILNS